MHLSLAQARRIALAAQGIGANRERPVGLRQVQSVISRVGQFQIDSVNVLARAHFMPLFTRLGAYDTSLVQRASAEKPRRLFEFWGHAASLIDISLYPLFQFRRDRAYELTWGRIRRFVDTQPSVVEQVAQAVAQSGPVTARDLDFGEQRRHDHWGWNWSDAKTALEWLFWSGRIAVAGRNSQFERVYDLPDRVIPRMYIDACQPWFSASDTEKAELARSAQLELVRRASRALGVATTRCLADYFRLTLAETRPAISRLVESGELLPVAVDTVKAESWVWHEAAQPRRIRTACLVSPFDSLVFERKRLAAFFATDYSIGLYTPPDKRVHGYYVYLFLLDESFAARTDLKADRGRSVLLVQSAWLEPGVAAGPARIAAALAGELRHLAGWLGLTQIDVVDRGDLATDLKRAVAVEPMAVQAETTDPVPTEPVQPESILNQASIIEPGDRQSPTRQ